MNKRRSMKHRSYSPMYATLVILMACGQGELAGDAASMASAPERVVKEVSIPSGDPVTVADLKIEGMSCEMMCGGAIKKALAKLPGVSSTEIVFNEGEELDHAIVTYDEGQVTDAELLDAVKAIHDGQYKVMAVTVTKQVKSSSSTSEEPTRTSENKGVTAYSPAAVLLPSLLTLLTRILQH